MKADACASQLVTWKLFVTSVRGVLVGGVGKAQTGEELAMLKL